jgi:uncharacterized FlaG/YvyC family protein
MKIYIQQISLVWQITSQADAQQNTDKMAVKQGSSNSAHMQVTHGSNMTDMAKFKDRLNLVLNKTSKLLEFKLSPRLASHGPHPTPRWSSHSTSAVLQNY